ncbi:MAG TPA: NAD(P)/FAD-dependent oxidoreductase [Candidatus Dormibacteraeota bacterium]|nr:NAD(P)/FAD-dependent oxidoreductase [Candidatus Dormibacteraeota bacterium]
MPKPRIIIVGGGAAGFFAAITCAEAAPDYQVRLLEKGPQFLSKVRISGGGRCNVTHACFDPHQLSTFYPRGGQALLGPFHQFQPADTVAWFESRGVKLKTESDGRMFPVTDSSRTVIDCLVRAAQYAGVELLVNQSVERVIRDSGAFQLSMAHGETISCDRLMLATGGCRAPAAGALAVSLGHTLEPPVPSLFTFHIATAWVRDLAGVSVERVQVSVPESKLCEQGPLLLTHQGVSGPSVLRLSAWGARALHQTNYNFPLRINWRPDLDEADLNLALDRLRTAEPARLIVNVPLAPLRSRLWERLVLASGIPRETRWANLSNPAKRQLVQQLSRTELPVSGKTLNQDEFVTCGGVRLGEVSFKSMESRVCPGLYFGGELLDIDGLTGGFNFQAAWTTGWLAGRAMASPFGGESHDHVEPRG